SRNTSKAISTGSTGSAAARRVATPGAGPGPGNPQTSTNSSSVVPTDRTGSADSANADRSKATSTPSAARDTERDPKTTSQTVTATPRTATATMLSKIERRGMRRDDTGPGHESTGQPVGPARPIYLRQTLTPWPESAARDSW